jgi:hypothetical protein
MSLNRTIQLEDISAAPAANTAGQIVITCPRGYRYRGIRLRLANSSNTTFNASSITEIQMRQGGGIQRRVSGLRLDALNALNGSAFASQTFGSSGTDYQRILPIFFEEPWRTRIKVNSVDPNMLAWKTAWLPENKPFQIVLSVAALGSGVAATISAEADIADDDDGKQNPIIKWNQDEASINTTVANISNVDNGLKAGEAITQISIFNAADARVPSIVRFEAGSTVIKQDQPINSITTELINAGMSPATANAIANAAHIVMDKNDALDDALAVGFRSSLLKVTYAGSSGASTAPIVTQVFGMPNLS